MRRRHDPKTRERTLIRRVMRALSDRHNARCIGVHDMAAYLDGDLSQDAVERVEAHLAACPTCLDTMLQARGMTSGRLAAPVRVLECVRDLAPDVRHRVAKSRANYQWAAAAVAALAIGLAGLSAGSHLRQARRHAQDTVTAAIAFEPSEDETALLALSTNPFSALVPSNVESD
jgi:anti-sigma factor RsiW